MVTLTINGANYEIPLIDEIIDKDSLNKVLRENSIDRNVLESITIPASVKKIGKQAKDKINEVISVNGHGKKRSGGVNDGAGPPTKKMSVS